MTKCPMLAPLSGNGANKLGPEHVRSKRVANCVLPIHDIGFRGNCVSLARGMSNSKQILHKRGCGRQFILYLSKPCLSK